MKRKFTVGLLAGGILDLFTTATCKGAMRIAEREGINLVIVPGKYIERDLSDKRRIAFEYQYNTLFKYIKKENIDALMIPADCIGCFTTKDKVREFVEQYAGIPCVLLASKLDGYVSINYDNYQGIRDALEYLIEKLNCTKIAMIGGPEGNTDTQERKNTFMQVMQEKGIIINEKNYISGDLARKFNKIYSRFLDENPDVEAVFCTNDDIALGLYEELSRRKKVPGRDVYVFGYDNHPFSAKVRPSLSTIDADAVKLGADALELLIRMLNGEKVEAVILPTRFIKRDSFGDSLNGYEDSTLDKLKTCFSDIFYRYTCDKEAQDIQEVKLSFERFIEVLYKMSKQQNDNMVSESDILECFDTFLEHDVLDYADMEIFLECLNQILYVAKTNSEESINTEFYTIINKIYNRIIAELEQHSRLVQEEEENTNYNIKLFASEIMDFEKGNDQSYVTLLENLDWLNIKNAYIYALEEPVMNLQKDNFGLPDVFYVKAVLKNGQAQSIPAIYQKVSIEDIFNNDLIGEFRAPMVMLPLFANEMYFGMLLCDMTEKLFDNGEFLVNQMGSAAKMIHLLKMNTKVQQQLEESLSTLKENNIALDTLSKSDALTGIWNRRGFMSEAKKLLEHNRKNQLCTLVAYVDMNNLKIINDKFGHDNGDFSIKLISILLNEVVGEKGIIGRIGGDEFAVILPYKLNDEGVEFRRLIEDRFEEFNQSSDKPYLVKVSVGPYLIQMDDTLTLEEALTFADEKLYDEKKKRSKNVIK